MIKLMIDDLRSELSQLTSLKGRDRFFGYDRRRLMKVEEEEKEVPQLTDLEIEEILANLFLIQYKQYSILLALLLVFLSNLEDLLVPFYAIIQV